MTYRKLKRVKYQKKGDKLIEQSDRQMKIKLKGYNLQGLMWLVQTQSLAKDNLYLDIMGDKYDISDEREIAELVIFACEWAKLHDKDIRQILEDEIYRRMDGTEISD